MIRFYDYHGDQQLIQAITEEIQEGWVSKGKYQSLFEQSAKKIVSSKYVYGVCNGTLAIECAYYALDLKPGDEILLPALGYMAAANTAILLGYIPVFVDVNPKTGNMDIESLERLYTPKAKALVFIHNYGNPTGLNEISKFCVNNNLKLIEDCAEGIFSTYNGKHIGNLGDIATYSFHAAKTITCGEGGLITTNNKDLSSKISLLKDHGVDRSKGNPYFHESAGSNFRISNIHSCIGFYSFKKAAEIIKIKRNLFSDYESRLKLTEKVYEEPESKSLFWAYPLVCNDRKQKTKIILKLQEHQIETRDCFVPVNQMSFYRQFKMETHQAELFYDKVVFLPSHHELCERDIDFIIKIINDVV